MNLLKPPFHPLLLLDCHPGPNGDALADSLKREEDHSLAQNHIHLSKTGLQNS
jgi:hypothetical protein